MGRGSRAERDGAAERHEGRHLGASFRDRRPVGSPAADIGRKDHPGRRLLRPAAGLRRRPAMTNPMQPVHQAVANDPVTPHDTPSSSAGFAMVTPHGRGPAPYNIQDGNDEAAITAVTATAGALAGARIVYPQGPRQAMTETLPSS